MRKKHSYPLTIDFVRNHSEELTDLFLKIRPHKGVFICACELNGSFLCDNSDELYEKLKLGEKLNVVFPADAKPDSTVPLEVRQGDGTVLGEIPLGYSALLCAMIARGIHLFCYLETKDIELGMLSLSVSVYSERY